MKYNIELEVITPLSIGSGNDNEWVPGADFVMNDGKVYVLDIQKAVTNGVIDIKGIEQLTNLFVKSDERGIINLFGKNLDKGTKYVFKLPVSTSNPIKAFLRTQLYDKPIVAGSSLKGAVRSALFNYLRTSERDNVSVFGTMNDGTDFMRFIHVSDIELPATVLVNTKLFNLRKVDGYWRGGWKHKRDETTERFQPNGFNTLYECVEPRKKGYGTINISSNAFDLMLQRSRQINISHPNEKNSLIHNGLRELFSVINHVTRGYLAKEKEFFLNYPADRTEELIDNINSLLAMIPTDNSYCLLKMSAGVGFHSITGDWQYNDYSNTGVWDKGRDAGKHKYKSRKTADFQNHLQLMGFVKIRELSTEESVNICVSLKEKHEKIIANILTPIREKERILHAKVMESERRQLEFIENARKENQYTALVLAAEQLYSDGQFDDAILKAEEAIALFSERSAPSEIIEKCNKSKELEIFKKGEEDGTKEKFSKPLGEIIKSISSIGNLTGTTAKWLKFDRHSIGETEFSAILDRVKAFKEVAPKEWNALPKKRKDFLKAIGEEWTNKLYSDIGM